MTLFTTAADWPVRTESVQWKVYDTEGNLDGQLMLAKG